VSCSPLLFGTINKLQQSAGKTAPLAMVILAIFVSGSLFSQRWITLLSDEWYLPVGVNNVMDIKYPGRAE
jgi:hypothetical protein